MLQAVFVFGLKSRQLYNESEISTLYLIAYGNIHSSNHYIAYCVRTGQNESQFTDMIHLRIITVWNLPECC